MSCSLFKPTTPLRTKIGVVVTAVYLLGLTLLVIATWPKFIALELNSLGDFVAGAVGPLAFLWLILGYMQQGDELKQNTDALRLQAAELANTVEQQKELVALGHQQLEREKQLAQEERDRRIAAARPKFEFLIDRNIRQRADWSALTFTCKNVGPECSHVSIYTTNDAPQISYKPILTARAAWTVALKISYGEPLEAFECFISYIDTLGNPGTQPIYIWQTTHDGEFSYLIFGEDDDKLIDERSRARSPQRYRESHSY